MNISIYPVQLFQISSRLILPGILLFAVCLSSHAYNAAAGIFGTAQGGKVILKQDIEAPAGARIHIQYGQVRNFKDVNQLEPYCYFYSARSSEALTTPLHFEPGEFFVYNVVRTREMVSTQPVPVELASMLDFFPNGGVQYTLATKIMLDAPGQPDLTSLVCSVWGVMNERGFVTPEEMQETLGNIAWLE